MFRYANCILTTATMLLNCLVAFAQESPNNELEKLLADTCRKHKVPSLTIAVVRSDETVTTLCSGVRKRGTDDAVELSDRLPLGSTPNL